MIWCFHIFQNDCKSSYQGSRALKNPSGHRPQSRAAPSEPLSWAKEGAVFIVFHRVGHDWSDLASCGRNQGSIILSRDSCPGSGVQFLTSEPRHILAVLLAPPKTCSAHLMVLLFLNSPRDMGAQPVCGYPGTGQAESRESRGKDWCEDQEGRTESLGQGSEYPPPFLSLSIPFPWNPSLAPWPWSQVLNRNRLQGLFG